MQQNLTHAKTHCTRHAFSDGHCAEAGCKECPGQGEIEALALAAPRPDDRWLYLLMAIACLAFSVCFYQGMTRAEHAAVIADRVG